MSMSDVTVWLNPRCSKCQGAERLLAEHGVEAHKIFYLDTPPSRTEISRVVDLLGGNPRSLPTWPTPAGGPRCRPTPRRRGAKSGLHGRL
jgi:glutaredoxin